MLTPDNERTVVKFLSAALGQGREQARAFSRRLPESIHPGLLATAQRWLTKSCLDASHEFSTLVQVPTIPMLAEPPSKKNGRKEWTPERRAALSRKMKKMWRTKHPSTPTPAVAADNKERF